MLIIRLKRVGKKNKACYQLVVAEKHRAVQGKFIEILGSFDPHTKNKTFKKKRVLHWISMGAGLSDTAHNLLASEKIITQPKRIVKIKKSKKKAKQEQAAKDNQKPQTQDKPDEKQTAPQSTPSEKEPKKAPKKEPKNSKQQEKPKKGKK